MFLITQCKLLDLFSEALHNCILLGWSLTALLFWPNHKFSTLFLLAPDSHSKFG
jgi:hypothetical protein